MKKSLLALALAAVGAFAASPSNAQVQYPDQMRNYMRSDTPVRQHARELPDTLDGPHHEVVVGGRVVGADPDPTIRANMLRDNETIYW